MDGEDKLATIDYTFKYIVIGDASVGKSNIILRYLKGQFQENYNVTIGLEMGFKNIQKNGKNYRVQIWDTAGQEQFRSISRGYYKNSVCAFVVYDITSEKTFDKITSWVEECQANCSKQIILFLIGNKIDLNDIRQVSYEKGKNFAETNNMEFFETSAKTGENIENAFEKSINMIIENIKNDAYDLDDENCGIRVGLQQIGKKIEKPNVTGGKKRKKKTCC